MKQVNCDDVFYTLKKNLEIEITIDEVFIIFYKVDKDSDSFWSPEEMNQAFLPREKEYKALVDARGGFYGSENDARNYFQPKTREAMKAFLRQFCECEISVEHVRQRIINKLQISPQDAFQTLDRQQKGYFDIEDLREFIKQ